MALFLSVHLTHQGCDYLSHRDSSAATLRRPRPGSGLRFTGREHESTSEEAPLVQRAYIDWQAREGWRNPVRLSALVPCGASTAVYMLLKVTLMLAALALSF